MRFVHILVVALVSMAAIAAPDPMYIVRQYNAYLEANDQPTDPSPFRVVADGDEMRLESWTAAVPPPSDAQLTAPAVLDIPRKYRKRDGVKWVEMTAAEKDAVDTAETSNTVTNDAALMAMVELINEAKGSGAKDITVSNLISRVKSKKK